MGDLARYTPDAEKLATPGDNAPEAEEVSEDVNETTSPSEPIADEDAPSGDDVPPSEGGAPTPPEEETETNEE